MLKKKFRLNLAKFTDFTFKVKSDQLTLSIGKSWDKNPQFAVIVPTKFCRQAVARNRTKRLIWEKLAEFKDLVKPAAYKIKVCGDFSKLELTEVEKKLKKLFLKASSFK